MLKMQGTRYALQGGLQGELLKSSRPTCVVRGVRCQQQHKDSMALDILIRQSASLYWFNAMSCLP